MPHFHPVRLVTLFLAGALLASCAAYPPSQTQCVPARSDTGRIARSALVIADFKRLNPCPATNQPRGACPGYVIDHVQPLCACGSDAVDNLQWQTVADAKEKDKWERKLCGRGGA